MKVGFFLLESDGCSTTALFYNSEMFKKLDAMCSLEVFPMIQEEPKEVDVAFVEGALMCEDQKRILKKYVGKAKHIVALGSEACFGFVPPKQQKNKSQAISVSVPVSVALPGHPVLGEEILDVIACLKKGKTPLIYKKPVCYQCTLREYDCLLMKGLPCIGSATLGGCEALCPAKGIVCTGCRGPVKGMNLKAFTQCLTEKEDITAIEEALKTFAVLNNG